MTINLTPAELREFAKLWVSDATTVPETTSQKVKEFVLEIDKDVLGSMSNLALALADAMDRVEQLTNEARLANNAVGSHANEIVMLSAKINDLKTVLKRAYNAMAEPHGDWKDIREAKSLIEIRVMLGGEPT